MKKIIIPVLSVFVFLFCLSACDKNSDGPSSNDVQFEVPESVTLNSDETSMGFRIMFGRAPEKTDRIILGTPAGEMLSCEIIDITASRFTIALPANLSSGMYNVYFQRGSTKKLIGVMELTIKYIADGGGDVEPTAGSTVYGVVSCNGTPLKDVVVSDGVEVVRTNADGVYQIKSGKRHGYVFVSIPSGYDVPAEGILPRMWQSLTKSAGVAERVDFPLTQAPDQKNHTMLIMGDIHLANRTGDRKQYAEFVADINAYIAANKSKTLYALTLGDMTWDLYWYSNNYGFSEYLADANAIKGVRIFHTIGNHDHDMMFAGDFDTVTKYKKSVAPTYYSFNIGDVHYIVLDNIECTNTGAGDADSRQYKDNLVTEQLNWLTKDLVYVPKSTPLCITMHAPLYTDAAGNSLDNAAPLTDIVSAWDQVHFFTAHTHKMYNVDKLADRHIYEHNAGAVCATWWWSANQTPGVHIAQDGAPGGYEILDVTETSFKWQFKPTDFDISHQFRSYDGNTIHLTPEKYVASGDAEHKELFKGYNGDWAEASSSNYVYINVWNWDPAWTVEVTEAGKALTVSKVSLRDPLHLVAYTAQRLNRNSTASFPTSVNKHTFRVKASSATSTLEIKVTDRFGNVYTETMKRPKNFSTDIYKK